jgi:hypothetical protein
MVNVCKLPSVRYNLGQLLSATSFTISEAFTNDKRVVIIRVKYYNYDKDQSFDVE